MKAAEYRIYTITEIASILKFSPSTVKRLIRSRKLAHIKEGQLTRITGAMLDCYLHARELEQGFIAK